MARNQKTYLEVQYSFETDQLTIFFPENRHARAYFNIFDTNEVLKELALQPSTQNNQVTIKLPWTVQRVNIRGQGDLEFTFQDDQEASARIWSSNSVLWQPRRTVTVQRLIRHWSVPDLEERLGVNQTDGHDTARRRDIGVGDKMREFGRKAVGRRFRLREKKASRRTGITPISHR